MSVYNLLPVQEREPATVSRDISARPEGEQDLAQGNALDYDEVVTIAALQGQENTDAQPLAPLGRLNEYDDTEPRAARPQSFHGACPGLGLMPLQGEHSPNHPIS